MSTKIYTAYRLKKGADLWEFLEDVHAKATQLVKKVFRDLFERILSNEQTVKQVRKVLDLSDCEDVMPLEVDDYIGKLYRSQLGTLERNPYNFDACLTVRKSKGRYYMIPYCDGLVGEVFSFLKKHKQLEEYRYWNNADKPEKISQRAWAIRDHDWNEMFNTTERWLFYLTLEICSWSRWTTGILNPAFDMMRSSPWKEKFAERVKKDEERAKAPPRVGE